jgi:hypothetical protein
MTTAEKIDLLELLLLALGGLWVAYNFVFKRERYPKLEFSLDVRLVDKTEDILILEFIAYLDNKSVARLEIDLKTFILKIRYLTESDLDKLTNGTILPFADNYGNKSSINFFCLNFPHSIKSEFDGTKEIFWLPREWDYIFIEGGIKQKVSLPLSLPKEAKYILIKSEFRYKEKKSGLHSAQSIFNVDQLLTTSIDKQGSDANSL